MTIIRAAPSTPLLSTRDRAVHHFQSLRPDPPQPGEGTEGYNGYDDLAFALSRVPMFTPRPVKVIAIGAGFSGIAMAKSIDSGVLPGASLTIYEKDNDVGGTWFENRYPGCACDIPATNYQFSWAPNPYWNSFYASRDDIFGYIKDVVDQHDLRKYIKTCHKVTEARWIPDRQVWQVTVRKTDGRDLVISSPGVTEGEVASEEFVDECDVLINCCGFFNNWKWPNVSNREAFKGQLLHSASWPANADNDINGKTVALIGNGSSGVQILPSIIDKVEKVYIHMKSPTWITAPIAAKFAGPDGSNFNYTEEQKEHWAKDPEAYLSYRKNIEGEMNVRFPLYIDHTPEQRAAKKFCEDEMRRKLKAGGKEDLLKLMLPDFAVGCRRVTPGNGFLESLCSPKCEVVWGKVEAFTEDGIKSSSGQETHSIDTIICATGFDLSCAPRFPIHGLNGVDLQEVWGRNPESYLSVTAANMPNYFTFLGPSSPIGHGSIVTCVEFVARYVCDLIKKLQTQNYSYLVPKPHIPQLYQKQALAWLDRTAFSSHCTSTYKNGTKDGKLISLHPGSRLHYFALLSTPRYEDFEWVSLCSDREDLTFAWHNNGFTLEETEAKEGADLTKYLNLSEHTRAITRNVNGYA
ncbi:cyclohexanone monooxygenase [Xylogone sp. PMI_703]|nr:cyclohexanone monooxygenase [Xylogone sp. PMI_703]